CEPALLASRGDEPEVTMVASVLTAEHWNAQYRAGVVEWDSNCPSAELRRVVAAYPIRPGRAVDLGCGTGTNALWLARRGFEVTGIDLSEVAIRQAQRKAAAQRLAVRFLAGDLLRPGVPGGPFSFFFDCGCYNVVRLADAEA